MTTYAVRKDGLGWRAINTEEALMPGEIVSDVQPDMSPGMLLAAYETAIDARLDQFAQTRGYRDGDRLACFRNSSNTTWAAEADRFIELRDLTWTKFISISDDVTSGKREVPSLDGLFNELPALTWNE